MNIHTSVKDRVVTASVEGTPVSCGGADFLFYDLDKEWAQKAHKGVWFYSGKDFIKFVPIEGTKGKITMPTIYGTSLRLTFDGWNDVEEIHLITKRMPKPITLSLPGVTY